MEGMTQIERQMYQVLQKKKQEVVEFLIQRLTIHNKDIEQCLNAHAVMVELTDNENTYGKLVEKENLTSLIKAACDLNNKDNQAYALNIIINIIKEFPDYDKRIGPLAGEFT
jgi:small nuclear ribonucleoprotein (snRNP)-like protein